MATGLEIRCNLGQLGATQITLLVTLTPGVQKNGLVSGAVGTGGRMVGSARSAAPKWLCRKSRTGHVAYSTIIREPGRALGGS